MHTCIIVFFGKDIDNVIQKAKSVGVKKIITAGLDVKSNRKTLELSKKYDIVEAALGLYPIDALQLTDKEIDNELHFIYGNLENIKAISEVGLDFLKSDDRDKQRRVFEKVITLGEKTKLPLIVHSRRAEEDVIEMLQSSRLKKIIMHCFSGNFRLVKKIEDNGWFLSIPTNVVFSKHFQQIVRMVNINHMFTETDSPYLNPYNRERNEPAFVVEAIIKIAKIKQMTEEEVMNNIYKNYQSIFKS
jgi:TatD DNase family protein